MNEEDSTGSTGPPSAEGPVDPAASAATPTPGTPTPGTPIPESAEDAASPGTWRSLVMAMSSWRTASVVLLSFSSGMPLGLVWIAIPDWMRDSGVDIRIVGLFTLAQAPWTFNVLWAPFMDRFRLPFLGRRRGWAALAQIALALGTLALSGVGTNPETAWVALALTLAIAFAAATQDVAVDAYAIDVLRRNEQGVAVGARIALYRVGMLVAGTWSITLAASWGWPAVCALLAALYLPMLAITVFAPEPKQNFEDPKTLREAVWLPFIGFLSRHRALEILLFVLLFKFGDNFAQALLRPFLNDMGYDALMRGGVLGTVALIATLVGAILGSASTVAIGLGPCLWIFGILQMVSNIGYVAIAYAGVNNPLMFSAMTFENLTQGLGTGAFSVLLFRLTQRRFSATQYALFSTLFGLARIISGPIAGFTVDAVGWATFFWITIPLGLPGLIMLWRFVPWGVKEPSFEVIEIRNLKPKGQRELTQLGIVAALIAFSAAAALSSLLSALKALRLTPEDGFLWGQQMLSIFQPSDLSGWIQIVSLLAFGCVLGLLSAAVAAARRGAGRDLVTG